MTSPGRTQTATFYADLWFRKNSCFSNAELNPELLNDTKKVVHVVASCKENVCAAIDPSYLYTQHVTFMTEYLLTVKLNPYKITIRPGKLARKQIFAKLNFVQVYWKEQD